MKPKFNEISDINIAVGVGKIKIGYNFLLQKKKNEIMECIQLDNIKSLHEFPAVIKADTSLPVHHLQTFQKGQ
jgi:hypothetical protein